MQFGFGPDSRASIEYRSLLRAILRAASYLPDPNARTFFKANALEHSKKRAFRVWNRRDDPNYAEREADLLELDRKKLRMLQDANAGERKSLLQVLCHTYGRTGYRRHELLQPLLATAGREDLMQAMKEKTARTIALYALAESQQLNQPPALTRRNPKNLKPNVPATNARGLPMPQKRMHNLHRKWYADLLDRILPPLPTKDWEQLRDWARGKNMPQIHVPRRSNPQTRPFAHFGKYTALEAIVIQGRIDKEVYGNRETHQITERFMQRLWADVFSTCPYMIHDTSTNKWRVMWGHQNLAQSMLAAANEVADELSMQDLVGG
ncbi:hypothetical protein CBER1_11451 [Cercospora berteroae]|uniref:LYR motif-containing protein Cup1-like N-terminal domain-containing protein n=1 Tax=Cercospora berteroae TaxID=357750 RepID=A0A2S6BZU5_9PEZI|nr:hypothetical protein CBER1_11451 [Cercospora berteroae]